MKLKTSAQAGRARTWRVSFAAMLLSSGSISHGQSPSAPPPAPPPLPAQAAVPAVVPPVVSPPVNAPRTVQPSKEPAEVLVLLKNGQRITGLLVDATQEEIVLRVAGIRTRLPMADIEKYDVLPSIMQRYNQLRETIGTDPNQIVHLAEWLQARERYALALTEVLRALTINPDHGGARRLRSVLEQQILLRSKVQEAPTPEEAPAIETATPSRPRPGEFPLLDPAKINLMQVYETNLADRPRLTIPREAVLKMLEANSGHPLVPVTREGREAILRKPATEILDLMFRLQARETYGQVEVIDQPRSMKLFRDDVHRTWLMSCATTACHGGLEAGRLVLHNKAPNSEASVYTNFLILSRFVTSSGRPLINWDNPERSPLLQYGLPREDSLFPHPVSPRGSAGHDAWKPEFRSIEEKLFTRSVEWLNSMYKPRPAYSFEYAPLRPFEPEKTTETGGGDPTMPATEPVHR